MTDTLELEGRLRDEVAIFYGYATANEMLNSSDAPASWWENDTRWKAADALAAQREQIERLEKVQAEMLERGRGYEKLVKLSEQRAESAERKLAECEEALVAHNNNARSFFQIANRVATELGSHALQSNFGAFADTTERMLKKFHEVTNLARERLAAIDKAGKGEG